MTEDSLADVTAAVRDHLALMNIDEVADLLKVKPDWIRDQYQRGKFPVVRLGRLRRFRPSDVQAYINGTWTPDPVPEVFVPKRGRPRTK